MTIRHLEIFTCICRHMSMTAAAKELGMSQPAVSRAVSELEAFYHAALFDRLNRKIQLTDAGHVLLDYAASILSQYEESAFLLRSGSVLKTCRLCANETAGETMLAGLVSEIYRQNPQADLRISVCANEEIEKRLLANTCDLAVMDDTGNPAFDIIELYDERISFFAADEYCPASSLRTEQLADYRLLVGNTESSSGTGTVNFLKQIRHPDTLIIDSISDAPLLSMAAQGLGIAILPESLVKENSGLHRIEVEGIDLRRRFYLTALHAKYLSTFVQDCARLIHEYCRGQKKIFR